MSLHTARTENGHAQNDVILEMKGGEVTFDMERGESRVLEDVDISIQQQETIGIVGESGSGKSMCASAFLDAVIDPGQLTGEITYYPPDGREPIDVLSLDKDGLKEYRWEEVSMVVQGAQSAFNPTMTIEGHFEETLRHHDRDIEEGMDRAHQLLEDVHLQVDQVFDSYPHELSGGMKQRALIALGLILEPNVVILDEPTAALDLLMQRSIVSLLEELREKYGLTLVFITHDLPLVSELADRLAVMYAFNIVEIGPTDRIVSTPSHPYTKAFLSSVPNIESDIQEMRPIPGSSPDPVDVPTGCSFHPRCPLATERCKAEDPERYEVTEGHSSACFHWEEAQTEDVVGLMNRDVEKRVTPEEFQEAEGERTDSTVVELDDVSVHFTTSELFGLGKTETVRAVDDVSLTIPENDVVALIGESGCGKTTLGKTAIGLQRPTSGSLEYRGQDFWETKRRSNRILPSRDSDDEYSFEEMRQALQVIHQDPGESLLSNYTVESILGDPLKRWFPQLDAEDRKSRIRSLLEYVGMSPADDYARRYPHQLSGGEQQRVALIRALFNDPELILADESISALDVSLRVEMMNLILDFQQEFGTSFLFVSHNLANARYLTEYAGGRIGVMYLGQLVEIGDPEQIIQDPKHPYTEVLLWATADLDSSDTVGDPPVRKIDIPDPTNPPSGCRFHTRCPYAREACKREDPELKELDGGRRVACFREDEDHEYWDSEPLSDEDDEDVLAG